MQALAAAPVRGLSKSLPVKVNNRVFPSVPNAPPEPPAELATEMTVPRLATDLAAELWSLLPYAGIKTVPGDKSVLVQKYVASLTVIHGLSDDVKSLVRNICEASLEFRQGAGETNTAARDKALLAKVAEMLAKGMPTNLTPNNILEAELVTQPIANLHAALGTALRESLARFVEELFRFLEHLVDQHLVGLVEWPGPNACRYHFFKEVIIQESGPAKIDALDTFHGKQVTRDGRTTDMHRQLRITEKGSHHHRHARHEHHVMDAFYTTIRNSRVVVPLNVQALIDNIPCWLYPFVRVIDGQIIRERIIEQDYRQEAWQQVRLADEPVFGCEPAVIIGPFVLAGWGPREIAAELARRELAAKNRPADPRP